MSKYYFIADLHLQAGQPEGFAQFRDFLTGPAREADALYILGDLFDVWYGDDCTTDFEDAVAALLKSYRSAGHQLYFMPGNRDFLLGLDYCRQSGMSLLSDPTPVTLCGRRLLLSHGDWFCDRSYSYPLYRAFVRHPYTIKCYYHLPTKWRMSLARRIRRYSAVQKQRAPLLEPYPVMPTKLTTWLERYQTELVIHGHTHIAGERACGQTSKRFILGAWEKNQTHFLSYSNTHIEQTTA